TGGAGDRRVDRGEQQRPADREQRRQRSDGHPEQRLPLAGGDAEEGAEEERLEVGERAAVEADEEEAEAEAESLDDADRRRVAGRRVAPGRGRQGEDEG